MRGSQKRRNPAHAGAVHARGPARPAGGDRGVAGAAGGEAGRQDSERRAVGCCVIRLTPGPHTPVELHAQTAIGTSPGLPGQTMSSSCADSDTNRYIVEFETAGRLQVFALLPPICSERQGR
jgi:hypothetical protein